MGTLWIIAAVSKDNHFQLKKKKEKKEDKCNPVSSNCNTHHGFWMMPTKLMSGCINDQYKNYNDQAGHLYGQFKTLIEDFHRRCKIILIIYVKVCAILAQLVHISVSNLDLCSRSQQCWIFETEIIYLDKLSLLISTVLLGRWSIYKKKLKKN